MLNYSVDYKLIESIGSNLFIETLKNKYTKIKICKELLNVLNINNINNLTKDITKNFNNKIDNKWFNDSGFYYLDNLGISVQGVDSNKCILEIINQCLNYNIKIMMKIQLENNKIIEIYF